MSSRNTSGMISGLQTNEHFPNTHFRYGRRSIVSAESRLYPRTLHVFSLDKCSCFLLFLVHFLCLLFNSDIVCKTVRLVGSLTGSVPFTLRVNVSFPHMMQHSSHFRFRSINQAENPVKNCLFGVIRRQFQTTIQLFGFWGPGKKI